MEVKKTTKKTQSRQEYLKKLAFTALFTALTMAATFIKVPAGPQGYANLGDAIILISAVFTGGISTMIAGGLGSCLTDVILGYPTWALFTLIIKGLEGLIAGFLSQIIRKKVSKPTLKILFEVLTFIFATLIMCGGYFVFGAYVVYKSIPVAVAELPFNFIQGGIAIVAASLIAFAKHFRERNIIV